MTSNADSKNNSILLIAAEASSCLYAKNLMDQYLKIHPETQFFGVGNKDMEAMGMKCFGHAEDMGVMGLVEVIKHYKPIKAVADNILEECQRNRPKFALLLDYPGFNVRLAKKLKALGIPVVYYISPQLWAWKKGRVHQIKKYVDEMLVVFPFEVDFYKTYGIEAKFVGHPLIEVVDSEKSTNLSQRLKPVLGLMPGSRQSEINYNLASQLEAARKISDKMDVDVNLLVAPTLNKSELQKKVKEYGGGVNLVQGTPTEMIESCDALISASGTATLQVALCKKPLVVMYRMNPVTAFFAKLLVRSVNYFCIVNLILKRKLIPEFFQEQANPDNLAEEGISLLKNEEKRSQMVKGMEEVRHLLGEGKATANVVQFLEQRFPL